MTKELVVCLLLVAVPVWSQDGSAIVFGGPSSGSSSSSSNNNNDDTKDNDVKKNVGTRAQIGSFGSGDGQGLLAPILGLPPTGGQQQPRLPGGQNNNLQQASHCCCTNQRSCPRPGGSLTGLINPRGKVGETGGQGEKSEEFDPRSGTPDDESLTGDIITRIVNNPVSNQPNSGDRCPTGTRRCCYTSRQTLNSVSRNCRPATDAFWRQNCQSNVRRSSSSRKVCGERSFLQSSNLKRGESSPEEFPWTCLLLKGNNDFVGSCAIIPDNSGNSISGGTDRVITAAHKLSGLRPGEPLKVRVLEYDASGFKRPELQPHEEFTVVHFIIHQHYDEERLSNDIAVLYTDKKINLQNRNGVNAACLPACRNMFDYKFRNGTGTRCWVAGWGKDGENGKFQFKQHKVDVPLFDHGLCERSLKGALGRKDPLLGNRFKLHNGELCAGGEAGKDACDGDGGSPLVCKSEEGLWHVVGLVAWGVGCADPNVPGIYVNVYQYLDFITANHRRG